jgi:hypothetical protein
MTTNKCVADVRIQQIADLFKSYQFSDSYLSCNQFSKSDKFNVNDYSRICIDLLKLFYPEFNESDIPVRQQIVNINKTRPSRVSNINGDTYCYEITFSQHYATIIKHFCKFNVKQFDDVFAFLVDNYATLKQHSAYNEYVRSVWKIMITTTWWYSVRRPSTLKIYAENIHDVVHVSNNIHDRIMQKFADCIAYYHVDVLHVCGNIHTVDELLAFIKTEFPYTTANLKHIKTEML